MQTWSTYATADAPILQNSRRASATNMCFPTGRQTVGARMRLGCFRPRPDDQSGNQRSRQRPFVKLDLSRFFVSDRSFWEEQSGTHFGKVSARDGSQRDRPGDCPATVPNRERPTLAERRCPFHEWPKLSASILAVTLESSLVVSDQGACHFSCRGRNGQSIGRDQHRGYDRRATEIEDTILDLYLHRLAITASEVSRLAGSGDGNQADLQPA